MSIEQIRSSPDTCVDVVALLAQKYPDLLIELLGEVDAMACDEPTFKVICAAIPAKDTNEARIKFNDQHYGKIQWEDAPQNKAVAGDVFIFWDCASNIFTFHKIHYVILTSERNILGMSEYYMSLTYDEMIAYGAKPKRSGTYYPKAGFEPNSELMRLI
jgi:hypothetical protein